LVAGVGALNGGSVGAPVVALGGSGSLLGCSAGVGGVVGGGSVSSGVGLGVGMATGGSVATAVGSGVGSGTCSVGVALGATVGAEVGATVGGGKVGGGGGRVGALVGGGGALVRISNDMGNIDSAVKSLRPIVPRSQLSSIVRVSENTVYLVASVVLSLPVALIRSPTKSV
jgi:hypothetical protein